MTYNREYARKEFTEHGEIWIQNHLRGKLNCIFDVGANIGEWSVMANEYNPSADIHSFEIVPDTYKKLLKNVSSIDQITPNGFGLGSYNGMLEMRYVQGHDQLSTQYKRLNLDNVKVKNCFVVTGDQYVESREIDRIDYLKIDVEGAEGTVLEGFKDTFQKGKIGIVQFEYSFHAILSRWLLVDSYDFLTPFGYHLGPLSPDGIKFHNYSYWYEKFTGADYVAVHQSLVHLFK